MKQKFINFIQEVYSIITRPEMSILPGQLSYFIMLSLIPMITLMGFIASFFSISVESLITLIQTGLPDNIGQVVVSLISGKSFDTNIGFFLIMILLIASNGTHSMIISANTLYDVPNANFLKRRIKAIILTFIFVFLFLFILLVPTFGEHILRLFHNANILQSFSSQIIFIYNLIKWPLTFIIIFFNIKLIYTIAPDTTIPSSKVNFGAMITTLLWTTATIVYSYYVTYFARYDAFYGNLSNIIILMLWLYILAYIFVLGMVLNIKRYDYKKHKIGS